MDSTSAKTKYSVLEVIGAIVATSSVLGGFSWFLGAMRESYYYSAQAVSLDFAGYENNIMITLGAIQLVPLLLLFGLLLLIYEAALASIDFLQNQVNNIQSRFFSKANPKNRKNYSYYFVELVLIAAASVPLLVNGFPIKEITGLDIFPTRLFIFFYFFSCLGQLILKKAHQDEPKYIKYMDTVLAISNGLFVLVLFASTLIQTMSEGYIAGCQKILSKSNEIIVYSNHALPLENESKLSNSDSLFEYTGYYGISGENFLALYTEVDSETSLPYQIIFLKRSEIIGLKIIDHNLSKLESTANANKCKALGETQVSNIFGD